MKHKASVSVPATGGTSLLVIFAVLCLAVFSLLSLNTVLAEKRISEAAARRTTEWYAADLQAQEMFARLRSGERVSGVEHSGSTYRYCVPVSGHQTLWVTLEEREEGWEVISWQTKAHPEDGHQTLPVWQGTEREG